MEELVAKYLELRDVKARLEAAHKEKKAKLDSVLDKIENIFLQQFGTLGIENVKTPAGTAYKTTKTYAKVGDWDATLAFIKRNDLWHMLERRVSKDAVQQYIDEHQRVPDGVEVQQEVTVNIRRS